MRCLFEYFSTLSRTVAWWKRILNRILSRFSRKKVAAAGIEYHVECVVLSCSFTCSASSAAADVALEVERSILQRNISNSESQAISQSNISNAQSQTISQINISEQYLKGKPWHKDLINTRLDFSQSSFLQRLQASEGC